MIDPANLSSVPAKVVHPAEVVKPGAEITIQALPTEVLRLIFYHVNAELTTNGQRRYLKRFPRHGFYAIVTGTDCTIDWLTINTMRKLSRVSRLWCEAAFDLAWQMERSSFYSDDRGGEGEVWLSIAKRHSEQPYW